MVIFLVKRRYFDALILGEKKAELRIGKLWKKIAEKILNGELYPIAVFKCGDLFVVREISRIEIYENVRQALSGGKWRILGIKAKNLDEAINEIRRLFPKLPLKPAVVFWLRSPKNISFDLVQKELKRSGMR